VAYVKAAVHSAQLVDAARRVLARDGVQGTTLRSAATEADVGLGTLSYVFGSKEQLLKAVIQHVTEEIAEVLRASTGDDKGLEQAIRAGLDSSWTRLVVDERWLPVVQYELVLDSRRTQGLEDLSRWQTDRYCRIVAASCQQAANQAGELMQPLAWPAEERTRAGVVARTAGKLRA
jgi:AcrR family transcriptional regulator